jgi:hypothetical protein
LCVRALRQCDRNYTYTLIFLFINNLMSSLGLQAAYTAGKLLHERAPALSAMFAAGKAAAAPHTAQSHFYFIPAVFCSRKDASRSVFTHFAARQ